MTVVRNKADEQTLRVNWWIQDDYARQVREELTSQTALLDLEDIESSAQSVLGDYRPIDPLDLARRLGKKVIYQLPKGPVRGMVLKHLVFVQPETKPQTQALVTLHEIAHVLLVNQLAHTHADVWALTLALAYPASLLVDKADLATLSWSVQFPAWVEHARRELLWAKAA